MKPLATDIIQHVADVFEVSKADITGRRRQRILTRPRQVTCYLIRDMTGKSYPLIGKMLGGRDHSTIIHGREVCINIMRRDPVFRAKVRRARKLIRRQKKPLFLQPRSIRIRRKNITVNGEPSKWSVPEKPRLKAKSDFTIEQDIAFCELDDLSRRVAEHYGRHM